MTPNQRFAQIAQYVQQHLQEMAEKYPSREHNPVYRWEHTQRVAYYGKVLAEAEGADAEVVVAACLLHDLAHFECEDDYQDHGRRGARLARPILEELGYTPQQIDNICFSVALHVDGDAGYEHPMTLEAQCVTDADNIDRFGAYRILQWCLPKMDTFPLLIEKLTRRIERLREYRARAMTLETVTGDRLFKQQVDRQIEFFQMLIDEHAITAIPQIER